MNDARRRRTRGSALLVLFCAAGCPAAPDAPEADPEPSLPAPLCRSGTSYAPGMPAFRDATADFGLDALGAKGTRLSVADWNGDGFPDLAVRRGGTVRESLPLGDDRRTYFLTHDGLHGFVDDTLASGVLQTRQSYAEALARPGEVWVFGDVDNDGDTDLYTGLNTAVTDVALAETSEILFNDGTGRFSLGARGSAIRRAGDIDVPAGAAFADIDLDGHLDLWVGQHNYSDAAGRTLFLPDRLYLGEGGGSMRDATQELGLMTEDWTDVVARNEGRAHSRAWGAAVCDLNGDAWPELLVPSYGRAPNLLWQAAPRADGVYFQNRSLASGYAYDDNQSWQDNEFAKCFCEGTPTAESCEETGTPRIQCSSPNWNHAQDREPFRLGGNSAGPVCADLDNDGHLDLLTSEIRHWWAGSGSDGGEILHNTGEMDVRFSRPGNETTGLAIAHGPGAWDEGHMSAAAFDFDNDGWLDVYIGASDYAGNRGRLYRQVAPLRFEEVAVTDGIDHNRSHGVAVADFDRDGDLDVVVGHSRARCDASQPNDCYPTQQVRLFENVIGQEGNFLQLVLEGRGDTNRGAIGARVEVRTEAFTQTREVGGGAGHFGMQSESVVHVGLGSACIAEVTVYWPNRSRSVERHTLPAGHRFLLVQGEAPRVAR